MTAVRRSPVLRAPALVAAALALAAATAAVAGWASGAVAPLLLPGIASSSTAVLWLLPVANGAAQAAQVVVVGALLVAAVLLPAEGGQLSPGGWYAARLAARAGVVWIVLQVLLVPLTAADLLGTGLTEVSARAVLSTALSAESGRLLVVSTLAALVVAVTAALALTRRGAVIALVAAVVALAAQASAGHASSSGDHQIAVSSLFLHLLGVVAWAGGLVALVVVARRVGTDTLAVAARRFSALALVAAVLVLLSGLVNAFLRLGLDPARWTATAYGPLVLVKLVATVALLALGGLHRRRTLPALDGGERRAFVRLALGEGALFAVVLGLAAALSRTPPPPTGRVESAVESILGFPMPPVLTLGRLVTDWYPEPISLTAGVFAVALYVIGVRRLKARGDSWSAGRTVAWCTGWTVLVLATSSGLGRYAFVLASAHMAQHMIVQLIAAPLVVLGAPVTLALRTLPGGPGSPREALLAATQWPIVKLVSNPIVAFALFATGPYVIYFTGLYEDALRYHWVHLIVMAHFFLVAVLFFTVTVGVDPLPGRPVYPVRILMVILAGIAHAIFGVALMQFGEPVAAGWWVEIARPWWPDALEDTSIAGGLAWTFGELPMFFLLYLLVRQWINADERQQKRKDRAAEIAGSREAGEIDRYNRMLADLAARDRGR